MSNLAQSTGKIGLENATPYPYDSQFPGIIESLRMISERLIVVNVRLNEKFEQLSGNNLALAKENAPITASQGYLPRTHDAVSSVRSEVNTLEQLVEAFIQL